VKKDGQVPMKDRLSFKRLLMNGRLGERSSRNFNSALDKIDAEDKQTYAISSRDGVMRDATGKGQRLDMSTYVSNVDK
jgi:hypothetical protein